MSAEFGSGWLAAYASRFQTIVTLHPGPVGVGALVLAANPRRWYVEVWGEAMGPQMSPVCPGPMPAFGAMVPTITAPQVWKYKDCPSILIGEFYSPYATGTGWLTIESILVGD